MCWPIAGIGRVLSSRCRSGRNGTGRWALLAAFLDEACHEFGHSFEQVVEAFAGDGLLSSSVRRHVRAPRRSRSGRVTTFSVCLDRVVVSRRMSRDPAVAGASDGSSVDVDRECGAVLGSR